MYKRQPLTRIFLSILVSLALLGLFWLRLPLVQAAAGIDPVPSVTLADPPAPVSYTHLTRAGILSGASQVQVSLNGGTATAGSDYSSAGFPQTITFGSGVVSQTVSIAITNDTEEEPAETINLTVSPLSNAVIGPQSSAVLQIEDNDSAAAPSSKTYLPVVLK